MSKVVLVSGSSINLGKSIILKYAESGFSCVITYLNHEKEAAEVRNEIINKYHTKVLCVKCDITKDEDIDRLYDEVHPPLRFARTERTPFDGNKRYPECRDCREYIAGNGGFTGETGRINLPVSVCLVEPVWRVRLTCL